MTNIYIDAMGGDFAPQATVEGAVMAVKTYQVPVTLIGNEAEISKELAKHDVPQGYIRVIHAETVIGFDEEPVYAVRHKTDSSLVVALEAMKGDDNAVLVSAGSTGALLTGALLKLGRVKGIKRPALGAPLPRMDGGRALLIDCGANADFKPMYFSQFATMGSIYTEQIWHVKNPKVALLNIGTEAEKGSIAVKEAYELLAKQSDICFIGNIESKDALRTEADVIVTDGFTGNILLKSIEGTASVLMKTIKDTLMASAKGKLAGALIKSDLSDLKKQFSSDEIGGTPFLGVKGGVIKAHGSSSAYAFQNAISQALSYGEADITSRIKSAIADTR